MLRVLSAWSVWLAGSCRCDVFARFRGLKLKLGTLFVPGAGRFDVGWSFGVELSGPKFNNRDGRWALRAAGRSVSGTKIGNARKAPGDIMEAH